MFSLNPFKAADDARAASSIQPEGAAVVSGSGGDEGLFSKLAKIASGFVNREAVAAAELLKPSSLIVPGGTQAVNAAAKLAGAGSSVVKAGASTLTAAGAGIKSGFRIGIAAVVVILFLFIRHNLK